MNAQPIPDDDYEPRGWWAGLKDRLFGTEETEEEEPEVGVVSPPVINTRGQAQPLRLQTARGGRVAVRLNAQVFEDAKFTLFFKAGDTGVVVQFNVAGENDIAPLGFDDNTH